MEDRVMEKSVTLEEALRRIEELEKENAELREELEYYRNRKLSGRQKHAQKKPDAECGKISEDGKDGRRIRWKMVSVLFLNSKR